MTPIISFVFLKSLYFNRSEFDGCYLYDQFNTDVDECALDIHSCNLMSENCTNMVGSFACICMSGFRKDEDDCTSKYYY